jgi:hypothetical protein
MDSVKTTQIPETYVANLGKVAWRIVDGEAVIVHVDSSAYYGLNASGTSIWEAILTTPLTTDAIAAHVSARYGLAREAALRDVEAFLVTLSREDLLVRAEAAAEVRSDRTGVSSGKSPRSAAYEPPALTRFGELEQLVLSGE